MIKDLSARVQRIKPSPTIAVSNKAEELIAAGKDVINLGMGEPDFDTPDFIKEAAIKAINEGKTKYTAVDGTVGLKKAIINKFARDNHLTYQLDQILVSCGAKHSISNLFSAVINPGDEVIIPAPYWVSYPDMVKLADGVPVIIKADIDQHFKMTPAQLEAAITPKTRLVVLNSPSNPTGVAYTAAELKALGQVLLKYPNVLIVTDDIYEHTYWGKEPFVNIVMVCPELYENTIVINGASKAYAMTGWRIGYAAGSNKIIAAMKKVQSQTTSNATTISQYATEAGLNGDQSFIKTMVKAYKERHDYIIDALRKIPGVKCSTSDGTFYCFPYVGDIIKQSANINNDIELAEYLLNEVGVALVPGSAFGSPDYLRISYSTSLDKVKDAMGRIKQAFEQLVGEKAKVN